MLFRSTSNEDFLRAFRPAPIKRLPTAGAGMNLEASALPMTKGHVSWWMQHVQPDIDRSPEPRADMGWPWPLISTLAMGAATLLRQGPAGFTLCLKLTDKHPYPLLPIALVVLVRKYIALDGLPPPAPFVWFMSTAPDVSLKRFLGDLPLPKAVGQAALDIAVIESFGAGQSGRIGLHAAPKGGDYLFKWYSERNMEVCPPEIKVDRKGGNDGRYFYYSSLRAYNSSKSLDMYRATA